LTPNLDNLDQRLNGAGSSQEVRSLVKGELRALDRQLQAALPGVTDELTRRHLVDARDEIKVILDPLTYRPSGAGAAGAGRGRGAFAETQNLEPELRTYRPNRGLTTLLKSALNE
jgi:hypothetical protein